MNTSLSEINDYKSLKQWLSDYCKKQGHACWHNYGPADFSLYLSDPVKILLMNAESGGYEGCENIDSAEYLRWIQDSWPTPRYSSLFITVIREYIGLLSEKKPIPSFDPSRWSAYYRNTNLLIEKMRATIYMNARITSNDTGSSREDKGQVLSNAKEFAAYRKKYIQVMKPRVIVCAGGSAKDSLFVDDGAFPKSALRNEPVFVLNGYIVVLTAHLSRPNIFGGYKALNEIAHQCAKVYLGTDWAKT